MKFRMVSLGCPKNLVDSEYLTSRLTGSGHVLSDEAELVVVNTCAFIADAARESIETIIQEGKTQADSGKRLVVTGCLVERYGAQLRELLPEVDLFVGRGRYGEFEKLIPGKGFFTGENGFTETFPRTVLTQPPSTYLKIQEGCRNRCSYCTIPSIRGPLVSRSIDAVRTEFETLLQQGFKEFTIIGQDITSFGQERQGGINEDLKGLLRSLISIKGDFFLRLLYMHPKGVDEELIELIVGEERIVNYFDLPIQHSEDRILGLMRRSYTKRDIEELVNKIRDRIPDATLRTTVIVGFPGETEEEFTRLCDFLGEWRFDNLGVFIYSKEEGTPAARLKGHLRKGIKKARSEKVMDLQKGISKEKLKRLKGERAKVIVESAEGTGMVGRILQQAPDVDGLAFIHGDCKVGQIREGIITGTLDYDVIIRLGGSDGTDT
ncbi:MAG TPA: 30S ribosomal protein S12 methylthiotransferase RimO [Syntrophorhabdales bacterium]|nr:30S ribosomal protein S12 methylthiotransferase RimO [Syntrophorhabdales bacterium]